jgi:hypothetical protein
MKILCLACSIEKYGYLIYVHYLLFLVKLLELKMCIKHVCETICTMIIDYVDHIKNTKSIV